MAEYQDSSPHNGSSWWRHQMETISVLLAFVRGIHRSPVNSPHKGQWLRTLMFSLIRARINGWINKREAGDLSRHHAHYDVTVMWLLIMGKACKLLHFLQYMHLPSCLNQEEIIYDCMLTVLHPPSGDCCHMSTLNLFCRIFHRKNVIKNTLCQQWYTHTLITKINKAKTIKR